MKSKITKVTKITIGRLYNLGNYEHVRYELTVDIGQGESPSVALRNVMRVLNAANPKPPVQTYEYETAIKKLAAPAEWMKNVVDPKERKRRIKDMVKEARDIVKKWDAWAARRKSVETLLDNIGATRVFKDAKLSWNDDDEDY